MSLKHALLLFAVLPAACFSCSFDTDCSVGSVCVKDAGQIYGYCAGGMNPGNSNDREPVRDSMDLTGKAGNTCSFNTDCGIGGRCLKESGYIDGVCVN